MAITAGGKAIAAFVGAFTLSFLGARASLSPGGRDLLLVAFAHGLAIAVMVSALARISGGHFNPAVTLGALVGRQITPRLAAVYWGSQLLGALVAAFGFSVIFPASVSQSPHLCTPSLGSPSGLSWTVTPAVAIFVEAIL